MKSEHDRLMKAKRKIGLVSSCTVSLDRAVAIASSTLGGTVFDVKLKDFDHRVVWRIKLLRDSERVKVHVDSQSGQILETKAEGLLFERVTG